MSIFKLKCLVVFLGCFLIISSVKAITVGPAKLDYSVKPGDTIQGQVFVMNEGNYEKTFYPVFEGFIEGETSSRQYLPDAPDLAKWFKIEESVILEPKGQRNVPFEIVIPQNADPGGHYAVMWWSTAPANYQSKPGEQVAIIDRAGILVYLRVAGEVKETGEITGFSAFSTTTDKEGKEARVNKRLFNNLPISFFVTFKNTGQIHYRPKGEVVIKDLFGRTKAAFKLNLFDQHVMPKTSRTYDVKWEAGALFGIFKAEAQLTFGESQQQARKTIWFVVLPWKLTLLVLLGLAFLIFIVPWLLRKYNRWLINKVQSQIQSQSQNQLPKQDQNPIKNENQTSLKNSRGTIPRKVGRRKINSE